MKISREWLSDYVDLPAGLTAAQLAHDLTLKTVEVEGYEEVAGDIVFEIDNKSLTNRPDLWGHHGIAREFAVIYGVPLAPLPTVDRPPATTGLVGELDSALCQRFSAVRFNVDNSLPTPAKIRERLHRIGEKSINLCVDLSNYVMFTVGQPNHVYDAHALTLPLSAGPLAEPAELELLTGAVVPAGPGTPVVRGGQVPVAAAGVMGGASTAAHSGSREFVLETATFKAAPVRRSSQRLNVRTAASARYEKALDTQRVDQAVDLFLHLLAEAAPEAMATAEQDVVTAHTRAERIEVGLDFIERRLGISLEPAEIDRVLSGLGFASQIDAGVLHVIAPTWRSTGDISLPHDIVEELARVHGFDELPPARPVIDLVPANTMNHKPTSRRLREQLAARGGLSEVLTYPWAADHLLAECGYTGDHTIPFEGAPAPDRGRLRPSLIPNLLEAVAANLRHRDEVGIFEAGVVFAPSDGMANPATGEVLPGQRTVIAAALAGTDGVELFRRAKGLLEMLRRRCHLIDLTLSGDTAAGWADTSARLAIQTGGAEIGTLALVRPAVRRAAGIENHAVACFEFDIDALTAHTSRENQYRPVSELPQADFDLSVVVSDTTPWAALALAASAAHDLVDEVAYVGEYRGSGVPEGHRSLTLRVTLRPREATLKAQQITESREYVLAALRVEVGAQLR